MWRIILNAKKETKSAREIDFLHQREERIELFLESLRKIHSTIAFPMNEKFTNQTELQKKLFFFSN
jgi:hypothetical protein